MGQAIDKRTTKNDLRQKRKVRPYKKGGKRRTQNEPIRNTKIIK